MALTPALLGSAGVRADAVHFEVQDHLVTATTPDDSGDRTLHAVSPTEGLVWRSREFGEVAVAEGGGSSTLPHKRNPAKAVLARACARLVHANVRVLVDGEHEHERAAGAWQAEWTALSEALAHAGGSAWALSECLEDLEVRPDRMRANMSDDVYAERDAFAERGLADRSGDWLGSAGTFVDRALARWRKSA